MARNSRFDIRHARNRYKACPRCRAQFGMGLVSALSHLFVKCLECGMEGPQIKYERFPSADTDKLAFDSWNTMPRPWLMKPLFIPLKTEYFRAFQNGSKSEELRPWGPRWNRNTCPAGRSVVLSHGYGKGERLTGKVKSFASLPAKVLTGANQAAIFHCYGTLDIEMAVIKIEDLVVQATAGNG